MAEQQDEQDKSEEATPFSLARARRKGTVARGQDLGFLSSLSACAIFAWLSGSAAAAGIAQASRNAFVTASSVTGGTAELLFVTGSVLQSLVRPALFLAVAVFLTVLVFEFIQTGPVFTSQTLKPDFSRLSPAKNLKRFVSPRFLTDAGKNIFKMTVYTTLAGFVIWEVYRIQTFSISDAVSLGRALTTTGLRLILLFVVAAAFFAIADQLIARRQFAKQMRMSRRQLTRENREREGDPRQKQKRKQLHHEFAKQSQSLRGVKGADVIITNPVHYAVALKYDPRVMAAPIIVSRGAHQVAQRLKRLAFIYGVTVVESPALARALYRGAQLNQAVPEAYYQDVADIYLDIRRKAAQGRRGTENV